jgi:multiple sugar transport system substrate-binding protein
MCLPLSISSFVVYYNKALFDAAGKAYPKAGWTWDEFLATAQALTKDTDGDGETDQFGLGFSPGINNVLPFIWQNGGDLLAEGGQKLALDTPEAREAIQFVVDWQSKYHIAPSQTEETAQSSAERFEEGTLAMWIASRSATPDLRTLTGLDWDVGPLPRKAQAGNILRSDGVCLSGKAKNPELAWKLIEHLVSPDGQTVLAMTGQIVPTNISVSQSAAFLDPAAKPANSQVWLDNIRDIHIVPPLANWPDIEERANEELESAYYGITTADTAVEEIMDQSEPFLQP